VAGFQYDVNLGPLFCNDTNYVGSTTKQDCVDGNGVINLNSLTWPAITITNLSCSSLPGYSSNCTITTFTATDTSNVASFVLQIASQPVFLDASSLKPDYGKISLVINYPWSSKTNLINPSIARVLLLAGTEAQAAAGAATFSSIQGDPAVSLTAVGGKTGFFSWTGTAVINSVPNAPVYVTSISDKTLNNVDMSKVSLLSAQFWLLTYLRAVVIPFWALQSYSTTFIFFSWDIAQPQTITWDPKVGVNGSVFLASSPVILFIALCLLFIYQRRE